MASPVTTYEETSKGRPPSYPKNLENISDPHTLYQQGSESCQTGVGLDSKGEYHQALQQYFISLDCAERLEDEKIKCGLYLNIANTYLSLENEEETFKYYGLSLKSAESRHDPEDMKKANYRMGDAYHSFEQFSKAIEFYNQYISLRDDSDDLELLAKIYGSIGAAHHSLNNYLKAHQYYQKFLDLSQEINYQEGFNMAQKNIREIKPFLNGGSEKS